MIGNDSDKHISIGVKFCGNCNPYIDPIMVLDKIKQYYRQYNFVSANDDNYAILLILNSCPVACAIHPAFSGCKIVLDSNSVNYELVEQELLSDKAIEVISECIKSLRLKKDKR